MLTEEQVEKMFAAVFVAGARMRKAERGMAAAEGPYLRAALARAFEQIPELVEVGYESAFESDDQGGMYATRYIRMEPDEFDGDGDGDGAYELTDALEEVSNAAWEELLGGDGTVTRAMALSWFTATGRLRKPAVVA